MMRILQSKCFWFNQSSSQLLQPCWCDQSICSESLPWISKLSTCTKSLGRGKQQYEWIWSKRWPLIRWLLIFLLYDSRKSGSPKHQWLGVFQGSYQKLTLVATAWFSIWIIIAHQKVFDIIQQFAIALNNLDENEDSNDLNLKIKAFFKRKTFESKIIGTNQQFYISPYIESHLNLKLYFPAKQY